MSAQIILTGNIGGNINTNIISGSKPAKPYAYFSIADTQEEKTIWYNIKAYGQPAEFVANYAKTGQKLLITGALTFGEYNNRETKTVTAYKIEGFSTGKQNNDQSRSDEAGTDEIKKDIQADLPF